MLRAHKQDQSLEVSLATFVSHIEIFVRVFTTVSAPFFDTLAQYDSQFFKESGVEKFFYYDTSNASFSLASYFSMSEFSVLLEDATFALQLNPYILDFNLVVILKAAHTRKTISFHPASLQEFYHQVFLLLLVIEYFSIPFQIVTNDIIRFRQQYSSKYIVSPSFIPIPIFTEDLSKRSTLYISISRLRGTRTPRFIIVLPTKQQQAQYAHLDLFSFVLDIHPTTLREDMPLYKDLIHTYKPFILTTFH